MKKKEKKLLVKALLSFVDLATNSLWRNMTTKFVSLETNYMKPILQPQYIYAVLVASGKYFT
jgi:hypothetical protein